MKYPRKAKTQMWFHSERLLLAFPWQYGKADLHWQDVKWNAQQDSFLFNSWASQHGWLSATSCSWLKLVGGLLWALQVMPTSDFVFLEKKPTTLITVKNMKYLNFLPGVHHTLRVRKAPWVWRGCAQREVR